jgi:hypothetical protein
VDANIEKSPDLTGGVAYHQNRVFAHVGGYEIAGLGYLTLVAKEQPATGEDPL